jgi:hypothetical protein
MRPAVFLLASTLMASLRQQFLVLVLPHLFPALFDNAAQSITTPRLNRFSA